MRILIILAAVVLGLGSVKNDASEVAKKPMMGTFHPDQGLFDAEKEKTCRLDSATGASLYLTGEHDNPLFESKEPNKVHLIIWWKTVPEEGVRYQLPHPQVEICYWEKGDLLMFHTFSAQGWIQFNKLGEGKYASGEMDMKLIKPHHNFSNSDYHYLGGNFKVLNP